MLKALVQKQQVTTDMQKGTVQYHLDLYHTLKGQAHYPTVMLHMQKDFLQHHQEISHMLKDSLQ
jgi:hypothetical protein